MLSCCLYRSLLQACPHGHHRTAAPRGESRLCYCHKSSRPHNHLHRLELTLSWCTPDPPSLFTLQRFSPFPPSAAALVSAALGQPRAGPASTPAVSAPPVLPVRQPVLLHVGVALRAGPRSAIVCDIIIGSMVVFRYYMNHSCSTCELSPPMNRSGVSAAVTR